MNKKVVIIISIIFILVVAVGSAYLIDMNCMNNNKPVIFSTWGYSYAPPVTIGKVIQITDKTINNSDIAVAMAFEKFYEDIENEYYFNCIKSQYIIVKYENGYEEDVKSAFENGNITLGDLDRYNIKYYTEKKETSLKEVVYNNDGKSLSFLLPNNWEYEILSEDEERYEYSIKFYPENSEKYAILRSHKEMFGVCGTGLKCKNITLNDGISASVGYYDNNEQWSFITFEYEDEEIVANNNGLKAADAEKAIEILKTLKYEENLDALTYTKIEEANLTSNEGVSLTELVRYDNKLYGINDTICLDYAGNTNGPIGKIDKLIDNQFIPKLNGETNSERFINSLVDYVSEDSMVLLIQGVEAVLFERVYEID